MISDRQLLDLIDEVMAANAKGLSHPHEQGNPSRFDLAVNLLAARSALAGKDSAGENAGLTQASDSLARISSSHPEDGGIREALEKCRQLASSSSGLGIHSSPGDFLDQLDAIFGVALNALRYPALNPAPLPIGEEREKS